MKRLLLIAIVSFLFPAVPAVAEQVACAKVAIEIVQELTLERVAFDAKLVVTNNLPDKDLTDIRVDVTIKDEAGNLKNELFFVKVSSLDGIGDVAGSGTVYANSKGEAHWLIVPSPGAGGDDPAGVEYFVGATLAYTVNGTQEIIPINPDRITVRPTAKLYLDYFMPHDVLGDNPFTTQTEAPVPFPLAVRVVNDGYGPANKLKIDSAQPKIVDNKQGLLVDFKLLGAAVNDQPVSPTLTVDMGNVGSKGAATGFWEMISTLSGRFESLEVSFTHDSGLGGELTSLIQETNAYYLTHQVKVNLPGRDNLLDFLADTDRDEESLPNVIFESEIPEGGLDRNDAVAEVTVVQPTSLPARPTPQEPEVQTTVDVSAHPGGWIYARMDDPSQGLLKLEQVVRADGVALDPHNFWVEEGLDKDYKPTFTLQFVDYRADATAPGQYQLVFTQPDEDVTPPVTTLVFDGPSVEGKTTYIAPETRVVLAARDNEGGSGVDQMFKKVGDDTAFAPALPFTLTAGDYSLEFYSVDRAGNVEATKIQALTVDDAAPTVAEALAASPATFSPQAPAGVSTARQVSFSATAEDSVPELAATLTITDAAGGVVRTLEGTATSGSSFSLSWDGRDDEGNLVAAGSYSAALSLDDGLGHLATSQTTVTVSEWFAGAAVDPVEGATQMYPAVSGTVVVWQDDRNGHNDIYLKDLGGQASSIRLTTDAGGQERPAIDGDLVVWQDDRGGDYDIYAYDLSIGQTFAVYEGTGDQTNPVVSGDWVAWQDDRNGNWDIWAKNLATTETIRVTSHDRDQIRPVLDGDLLVWEDYRHGLGEIYRYDLESGVETRLTFDIANQFLPTAYGGQIVWTDQRDGNQEIYGQAGAAAQRLTYGSGDRSQASLLGSLLVYTDFSQGSGDSNLAFIDLATGSGGPLTIHPARQEEPALGEGFVVWQDDRDGTWQLYRAALETAALPVEVELMPGFNLVASGQLLVDGYGTAANLVGSEGVGVEKAMSYSAPHGRFFEADLSDGDFALVKGAGLILYAEEKGILQVAATGETTVYSLLPGTNHIGLLAVPVGYRAYDLLRSLGLDKVISVRRFDNTTGLWRSAAVRGGEVGPEIVGSNFVIKSGDGLVVTMKERVDGWKP